jgi:hypothetical protein
VIVACYAAKGLHWGRYVSSYFFKQTILNTWNRTVEGYFCFRSFTKDRIVRLESEPNQTSLRLKDDSKVLPDELRVVKMEKHSLYIKHFLSSVWTTLCYSTNL